MQYNQCTKPWFNWQRHATAMQPLFKLSFNVQFIAFPSISVNEHSPCSQGLLHADGQDQPKDPEVDGGADPCTIPEEPEIVFMRATKSRKLGQAADAAGQTMFRAVPDLLPIREVRGVRSREARCWNLQDVSFNVTSS